MPVIEQKTTNKNKVDFDLNRLDKSKTTIFSKYPKNQVPDEDGEREIVELWKESNRWESWDKHLDYLIERLQQE